MIVCWSEWRDYFFSFGCMPILLPLACSSALAQVPASRLPAYLLVFPGRVIFLHSAQLPTVVAGARRVRLEKL